MDKGLKKSETKRKHISRLMLQNVLTHLFFKNNVNDATAMQSYASCSDNIYSPNEKEQRV